LWARRANRLYSQAHTCPGEAGHPRSLLIFQAGADLAYNGCNGVIAFITRNWIDILQSIGIIGGLFTSAYTIHKDTEVQRVQNLFALTKNHREIWSQIVEKPELARVLDPTPDLKRHSITDTERLFVLFLILHLASSFEATKHGMYFAERGLRADVREFFTLPIPLTIWNESKQYQQPDFRLFVDEKLQLAKHD
jgi:hypothetical protein